MRFIRYSIFIHPVRRLAIWGEVLLLPFFADADIYLINLEIEEVIE